MKLELLTEKIPNKAIFGIEVSDTVLLNILKTLTNTSGAQPPLGGLPLKIQFFATISVNNAATTKIVL